MSVVVQITEDGEVVETVELTRDMYLVICGEDRYVDGETIYPKTGTSVITTKRGDRKARAREGRSTGRRLDREECSMSLAAVGARMVVREAPAEQVSKSGLVIPQQAQKETSRGVVLNVGPEVREVNVGDKVVFTQYDGEEIPRHLHDYDLEDGEAIVMLYENEITAVESE